MSFGRSLRRASEPRARARTAVRPGALGDLGFELGHEVGTRRILNAINNDDQRRAVLQLPGQWIPLGHVDGEEVLASFVQRPRSDGVVHGVVCFRGCKSISFLLKAQRGRLPVWRFTFARFLFRWPRSPRRRVPPGGRTQRCWETFTGNP